MAFLDDKPTYKEFYEKARFAGRVGFGERPAVVVIDMAHGWCDPASPMGADFSDCIAGIRTVLQAARQIKPRIPIIFTTMGYHPDFHEVSPTMRKKLPVLAQQVLGSRWVELVPELERQSDELLIVKKHPSCFTDTNFLELLISAKVDTLIITGCSTSGCVHATCEDAASLGYHTIVALEAVGDRDPSLALPFLIDMDVRYGDVVGVEDVIAYLGQVAKAGEAAQNRAAAGA